MKKIFLITVISVVGYYIVAATSAGNIGELFYRCSQQLGVSSRLKAIQSDAAVQQLSAEVGECVNKRKSLLNSFFEDDEETINKISFNKNDRKLVLR